MLPLAALPAPASRAPDVTRVATLRAIDRRALAGASGVVAQRRCAPGVRADAAALCESAALRLDHSVGSPADVAALLEAARVPESIASDVRELTALWFALTAAPRTAFELFVTDHDECRKFHIDHYALRLLCTYHGPGTEVAPGDAVRREHLGRGDLDADEANREIVPDRGRVLTLAAGDVLVMRGLMGATPRVPPLVHRSPSIAAAAARRLVLKLTLDRLPSPLPESEP